MKKTTFSLALILGVLISLLTVAGTPVQAQEDLDTILARAAAKSFLVTLTRPELSSVMNFYVLDTVNVDDIVATLGDVADYKILKADWLTPGQTYEVEATLQPGNRTIIVHTAKHNSRWRVEDVELTSVAGSTSNTSGATPATTVGPQPIVGNGTGTLVFQTRNGGDIYLVNADGTDLRYLTRGLDPQLSPDGNTVAFTRWENGWEMLTINVDGANETARFSNKAYMKSPTWSADGSRLVFSHLTFLNEGGFKKYFPGTFVIRSLREGEKVNFPTIPSNARGLKQNDDGSIEYTIPPDAHWHLAQVNVNTNEYQDLSTGSNYNYAPNWHPTDPNTLLIRGDKGVFMYNTLTQTGQPITFEGNDRGPVVLSPDGTKLAVSYWQGGHWEIHTMNSDGSNRQRLTETPLWVLANQSRSQVIMTAEGYRTLTSAQPDGQQNPHWNNAAAAWSPDGSKIAFMTDRTGQWEIWIMNADGSDQHAMFSNGVLEQLAFEFAGVDERMISWQ